MDISVPFYVLALQAIERDESRGDGIGYLKSGLAEMLFLELVDTYSSEISHNLFYCRECEPEGALNKLAEEIVVSCAFQ